MRTTDEKNRFTDIAYTNIPTPVKNVMSPTMRHPAGMGADTCQRPLSRSAKTIVAKAIKRTQRSVAPSRPWLGG